MRWISPNNPVGLDATAAWYGFGLMIYAAFDFVFLTAFYKSGYRAGRAFILASIPMVLLMAAAEAAAHIRRLPGWTAAGRSICSCSFRF